jgi:4-aminobutyrate aminotransferase-like enzyme
MARASEMLSFPDTPHVIVPPPGPGSRRLLERQAELETSAVVYSKHFPIAIERARGSSIEDVDGNHFLDWVAGVCVLNLGHNHPRVRAAVDRQLDRLWHGLEIPTETRIGFLEALRERLPGELRGRAKTFFTVTGGDAIETAVSIADHVKGRRGTIVFSGAYHGVHGGAVGLTSGRKYHKTSSFQGGRFVRVPFPDTYRPLLDDDGTTHNLLRYIEHLVADPNSGVDEVSSILVEPILGEGGYVIPPDDFLPGLRELCDRHDLFLIADEVQTGMGRTGKRWAVEHSRVSPDLLCAAKSLGGGIPLSVVAYRPDLGADLPPAFHLGTYRANPLGLAAGTEVLKELDDGGWIDRVAHRGAKLLEEFRSITSRDGTIGEVRGRGFMIGIECVTDGRRRQPSGERAKALRRELLLRGVLMHTCGGFDHVLRFMSPLNCEDPLLERGLEVFADALAPTEAPVRAHRPVAPSHLAAEHEHVRPIPPGLPGPEPIEPGLPFRGP